MSRVPTISHEQARAAIQARSDGLLQPQEAASLRHHLVDCHECRAAYDRAAIIRRLAAGSEANAPLPGESRLLLNEVLGQTRPTTQPVEIHIWRRWQWAAGLAVAVLVVVVAAPWNSVDTSGGAPIDEVQERGAVRALPGAGFGLSGVDGRGAEYEVVESDGICREDGLRFYVNRREERYGSYFIFGVDGAGNIHWYAPLPEERESYPLPRTQGVPEVVPFEVILQEKHPAGRLVVIALFSHGPLAWEAVSAQVPHYAGILLDSPEEGAKSLAQELGTDVLPATRQTRIITCGGNQ
jgi:hypothetical protein